MALSSAQKFSETIPHLSGTQEQQKHMLLFFPFWGLFPVIVTGNFTV